MCAHGDTVQLDVMIPANHTGALRIASKLVDRCISEIVEALNLAGLYTRASCCGHGKWPGDITLWDGRKLTISQREE